MAIDKLQQNFIYLISCALNGMSPEKDALGEVDLSALFMLAKRHMLTSLVCTALDDAGLLADAEDEIAKKWTDARIRAVRKNMLFDAERKKICAAMDEAGIWYMPLKGVLIKDLYPKYGMREMADNDILYDKSKVAALKEIFDERGYSAEMTVTDTHDVYRKAPVFKFEMHRSLFVDYHSKLWAKKYRNIEEKLIRCDAERFEYRFSAEEFYIFVILHAFKHFKKSGTGMRTLADIYVLNRSMPDSLDRKYIESELSALGAAVYEAKGRVLAEKLFSTNEYDALNTLTLEENELLQYYMSSGTFGTVTNMVMNSINTGHSGKDLTKREKYRYVLSRLFPNLKWWQTFYPITQKYPFLISAAWVFRAVRAACKRPRKILVEIRTVIKL